MDTQNYYMQRALQLAQKAADSDEVPVGAVVVRQGQVIAEAYNLKEQNQKCTHHAELLALEKASQKLNSWRLTDCELYVTLEPCIMCAGALQQSRLQKLIYGCPDPKGGGVDSLYQILSDPRLNHQIQVVSGVLEEPCSQILKSYFKKKREQKKESY